MKELQAIVRTLTAIDKDRPVLATLVSVEGSSYRRPGARLLLLPDGTTVGSISGGCLEEDVITRARQVAASRTPETVVYDTTAENDLVWGVGMGCHGVVRVLIEPLPPSPAWVRALADGFARRQANVLQVRYHADDGQALGTTIGTLRPGEGEQGIAGIFSQRIQPPLRLVIFGAGNDAQPLARLADELGWRVVVADPRPAFATRDRFPMADSIHVGPAEALPGKINADDRTVSVVMTHHYVFDVPILRAVLQQPLPYIGLLGPRKRAEKILADLRHAGVTLTPAQRAALHAPVGLDLGADGPAPVALAIMAEIEATLNRRNALPLRDRTEPIHS